MRALVFGAGRLGCGFVGKLLSDAGYSVTFVCRSPEFAAHLDRTRRYVIRFADGRSVEDTLVSGARALSTAGPAAVTDAVAEADLIATAVGVENLPDVARQIAAGLSSCKTPTNVIAFENDASAGRRLRERVAERVTDRSAVDAHGFSLGLAERVVSRRIWSRGSGKPAIFVADRVSTFRVQAGALHAPMAELAGMIEVDDVAAWVLRKLCTYSAGHATTAYLGYLKGYRFVHSAIRDPEIRQAALDSMREGQRGLAARYSRTLAGDEGGLFEILTRFENAGLRDPVLRVARDPIRKLGCRDRLMGAARLAERAGVTPRSLALAAAAALCFYNPSDQSAVDLHQRIGSEGVEGVLRGVCDLDPRGRLGTSVRQEWNRLARGWEAGNVLVDVRRTQWSWRSAASRGWA